MGGGNSNTAATRLWRWLLALRCWGVILVLMSGCSAPPNLISVTDPSIELPALFTTPASPAAAVLPRALAAYPANSVLAVTLNRVALTNALDSPFSLTLPNGKTYQVIFERQVQHPNGDRSLIGYVQDLGPSYTVNVTIGRDAVFGQILTKNGVVTISSDQQRTWLTNMATAGLSAPSKKNDTRLPNNSRHFARAQEVDEPFPEVAPLATHTVIDVLVVYSSGFANKYPNGKVSSRLNNLFTLANTAFTESQIDLSVRMVHAVEVDYADTIDNDTALDIFSASIPPFDQINAVRDTYGADLVTFIRPFISNASKSCGVSWLNGGGGVSLDPNNAFSVVAEGKDGSFFCDEYTLAHELGHSMGAAHDIGNASTSGRYNYSYGHGTSGLFGTVMSYISPQSGKFSNPNLSTCLEQICGVANTADNAKSLNVVKDTVASFRGTIVTEPVPPEATTQSAVNILENGATLQAQIEPNGSTTQVYFEYGVSSAYGLRTVEQTLDPVETFATVLADISGLQCETNYVFRVVASHLDGQALGQSLAFTTAKCAITEPVVIIEDPTQVTATTVQFNGSITPNNPLLTYYFAYGKTTNYGLQTLEQTLSTLDTAVVVSAPVSELLCGDFYNYRLVTYVDEVKTVSGNRFFRTTACAQAPVVLTQKPSEVLAQSAVLNGSVNAPGEVVTVYFEYGLPGAMNFKTPEQDLPGKVATPSQMSASIGGLQCGIEYAFRLVARNTIATTLGDAVSFVTMKCQGVPQLSQPVVDNTVGDSAVLITELTSDGNTEVWFEYGLDGTNYGLSTVAQVVSQSPVAEVISDIVTGLECGMVYQVRAVATNAVGKTESDNQTFTTPVCKQVAAPPQLGQVSAVTVTDTSIELSINITPNGQLTTVFVEYGTTDSLGESTIEQTVGAGNAKVIFNVSLTNLVCGTTYSYRINLQNASSVIMGNIGTEQTAPCAQQNISIQTGIATSRGKFAATLNAELLPIEQAVEIFFERGVVSKQYSEQSVPKIIDASLNVVKISEFVSNLTCGTSYYFRAVAKLDEVYFYGDEESFVTIRCVTTTASIGTEPPTDISEQSARFHAIVNPESMNTRIYFEFGPSLNYGEETTRLSIGDGTLLRNVSWVVNSLICDTTYYYRIAAISDNGTVEGKIRYGDSVVFQTLACDSLVVSSARAVWMSDVNAVIAISLVTSGKDTTVSVNYRSPSIRSGSSSPVTLSRRTIQIRLSNLVCGEDYEYVVVADNGVQQTETVPQTFSTKGCALVPEVKTLPALGIGSAIATLQGSVLANGTSAQVNFLYGQSTTYDAQTDVTTVNPGVANVLHNEVIANLVCATTYYYQMIAANEFGQNAGEEQSFTTLACGADPIIQPVVVVKMAAGIKHTVAIGGGGNLITWGDNENSQLGALESTQPLLLGVSDDQGNIVTGVTKVAAGGKHSLALTGAGLVLSWGDNTFGQLGNGTVITGTYSDFVLSTEGSPLETIHDIAAGKTHSIALKRDGTVWVWGSNNKGQLGISGVADLIVPMLVPNLFNMVAVAAGDTHSLALSETGKIFAWGNNEQGQLGLIAGGLQSAPIEVVRASNIKAIAAGATHSLALRDNGVVFVWGNNGQGQLGLGHKNNVLAPENIRFGDTVLGNVIAIAAGEAFSLALQDSGQLLSWGDNVFGQLGNQRFSTQLTPGYVLTSDNQPLTNIDQIAAGDRHVVALTKTGQLLTWGDNSANQLGLSEVNKSPTPLVVVDATGNEISLSMRLLIVDPARFEVSEGRKAFFKVKPSAPPPSGGELIVNINITEGDEDLSVVEGAQLTFTQQNWQQHQIVVVAAKRDTDNVAGEAKIEIAAQGYNTISIEAVEQETGSSSTTQKAGGGSVSLYFLFMLWVLAAGGCLKRSSRLLSEHPL